MVALPNLRTGQREGSQVLLCVLFSIRSPFFSSLNVMVTNSAFRMLLDKTISFRFASLKIILCSRSFLVLPGFGVFAVLHIRQAKKNPPMIKSIAWSSAEFFILLFPRDPSARRNFGVSAFCCSIGGPDLSKALKSFWTSVRYVLWSVEKCKGHFPTRNLNAADRPPRELSRVDVARGFVLNPLISPSSSNLAVLYTSKKVLRRRMHSSVGIPSRVGGVP